MSSVRDERYIFTGTDGSSLGSTLTRIEAASGSFAELQIAGTPVPTHVVGADTPATLQNKDLVDATCDIVHMADTSRKIKFNAENVAPNSQVQISPAATMSRNFTLNDPGEDATILLSRGAQSIVRRQSISAPLLLVSSDAEAGGSALDMSVEIGGAVHTSSVIPSQRELRFGGAFDAFIRINTSGLAVKCGTAEFEISSDGTQSDVTVQEGTGLTFTNGVISLAQSSAAQPGAMSAAHYSLLAGATAENTPLTLPRRNADGGFESGPITASLLGNADTATTSVSFSGPLVGEVTGGQGATVIAPGAITDAKIAANAGIVDTKLAIITTAGRVANSATTATPTNTVSTIVARDGSGNFSAGIVTASLAGNATTATTAQSLAGTFGGDVTGTQSNLQIAAGVIVNGDININAAIEDAKLATLSTSGKVANSATTATPANTPSSIVARDGSGNFSAGIVTASLAGNATTSTQVTGSFSGDVTGVQTALVIAPGAVTNAKVATNAGIEDTKLAQITTAGKVANSATTATSSATNFTITMRDGSGNFAANNITATLMGNAATATTSQNVSGPFGGDVTGTQSNTVIAPGAVTNAKIAPGAGIADTKLAQITSAGKVANSATTATDAASNNTIVSRDGSGNFSAGTVTASLMGNATTATTAQNFSNQLAGDVIGGQGATLIAAGAVTNNKIAANAGIVDTKLATISSAGKVANSATSATSSNTPAAIVARDGDGNFSAGIVTASLAGNATTATTSQNFSGPLAGDVTGDQGTTVIAPGAVTNAKIAAGAGIVDTKLAQITTTGKVANSATTAVSSNTNGAIVLRDGSGNFSAGIITASLAGNADTATSTSNFSGALGGDVTGTQSNTVIAPGAVTNNKIAAGAGIVDTKLAQITTAGKVANSATTATRLNTDASLVLRDAASGTQMPSLNVEGDIQLQRAGTLGYRTLSMNGGTAMGYLYSNFQALGEGIHLSYNAYHPPNGSNAPPPVIGQSGIATSRVSSEAGRVSFHTGAAGVAPAERLAIGTDIIAANGAVFRGAVIAPSVQINTASSALGALALSSGAADRNISIRLGRTGTDSEWGVAGVGGAIVGGSAVGDTAFYTSANFLFGGTGIWARIIAAGLATDTLFSRMTEMHTVAGGGTGSAATRRWATFLNGGEGTMNAGNDWTLNRYDNSGTLLGPGLTVRRSDGFITTANGIMINGTLSATSPQFNGIAQFVNSGYVAQFISGSTGISTTISVGRLVTEFDLAVAGNAGDWLLGIIGTTPGDAAVRVPAGRSIVFGEGTNAYARMSLANGLEYLGTLSGRNLGLSNSGNTRRWQWGIAGTESSGNAGADLALVNYSDAGAPLGTVLSVRRTDGLVTIPGSLTVSGTITGNVTVADGSIGTAKLADGAVTNVKIAAGAGIVDTKLATISTAGKVANSATTATSSNTVNTIVLRNSAGISLPPLSVDGAVASTRFSAQASTSLDGIASLTGTNVSDTVTLLMGTTSPTFRMGVIGTDGTIIGNSVRGDMVFSNPSPFIFGDTTQWARIIPTGLLADAVFSRVAELHTTGSAGASATRRWQVAMATTEAASNVGNDWTLNRYDNTGTLLGAALTVRRSDGRFTVTANTVISGQLSTASPQFTGQGRFTNPAFSCLFLSGAAGQPTAISLGRTGAEFEVAIAGGNGDWLGGYLQTMAGDGAFRIVSGRSFVFGDSTFAFGRMSLANGFEFLGAVTGQSHAINNTVNVRRWLWSLSGSETGSNVGGNLGLASYNDAGALITTAISVRRSDGMVTIPGNLTVSTSLTAVLALIKTGGTSRGAFTMLGTAATDTVTMQMGTSAVKYEMGVAGTAGSIVPGSLADETAFYNAKGFSFGGNGVSTRITDNGIIATQVMTQVAEMHLAPIPNSGGVSTRRWQWSLVGSESTGNAGSALSLAGYNDAGTAVTVSPLSFSRNTNVMNIGSKMAIDYDGRFSSVASGNSTSYFYCAFTALGDGYHMGHNLYYRYDSATPLYANSASTSRVSAMAGYVALGAGGAAAPATEYLRVDSGANIQAMNGATFRGPVAATTLTATGAVATSGSVTMTGTLRTLQLLSGATNQPSGLSFGLTGPSAEIGLASGSNEWLTGTYGTTQSGDLAIRTGGGGNSISLGGGSTGYARFNAAGLSMSGSITTQSGSTTVTNAISIGRTGQEADFAIVGVAGTYAGTGPYPTVVGNAVLRTNGNLVLATGNTSVARVGINGIESVSFKCRHRGAVTDLTSSSVQNLVSTLYISSGGGEANRTAPIYQFSGTSRHASCEIMITLEFVDDFANRVSSATRKCLVQLNGTSDGTVTTMGSVDFNGPPSIVITAPTSSSITFSATDSTNFIRSVSATATMNILCFANIAALEFQNGAIPTNLSVASFASTFMG